MGNRFSSFEILVYNLLSFEYKCSWLLVWLSCWYCWSGFGFGGCWWCFLLLGDSSSVYSFPLSTLTCLLAVFVVFCVLYKSSLSSFIISSVVCCTSVNLESPSTLMFFWFLCSFLASSRSWCSSWIFSGVSSVYIFSSFRWAMSFSIFCLHLQNILEYWLVMSPLEKCVLTL